ncbi:unnamed protein product [Malus baccata var. baccata]
MYSMVEELGYDGSILYHYRIPGMSYREGLRLIERDQMWIICVKHQSANQATLKHKLLMNLDESGIVKRRPTMLITKIMDTRLREDNEAEMVLKKGLSTMLMNELSMVLMK